jgi:lysophospholipase L1-like esterase
LIGTNDLIWWLYRHDDDILKTYEHILEHIKQAAPQTQVFIQSILPRKKHYCKRIKSINSELKKFAKKFKYTYIDLFPHFADATGALKAKFNNDHLHLLAPGYETWVKLLTPYIDNFRKK